MGRQPRPTAASPCLALALALLGAAAPALADESRADPPAGAPGRPAPEAQPAAAPPVLHAQADPQYGAPVPPPPVLAPPPAPPAEPALPMGTPGSASPAAPASSSVPPLPARDPGEQNAATRPMLSFGNDLYFVKPILAIAGGIQIERLLEEINKGKEDRNTTVAITRFGFEGRLGRYVSFRSEFERNIGAHGSGIWEGTASFSVRDQFLRLSRWGVNLDGGIILDEASVDFFSLHTADLLLADKYTRNPLLYSGFNRGQGLKASYGRWGFRLGLAYTEANPLSTSTSYQVGGAFAGGSRFWEKPLGNFRIGQPDDDFHFRILSPSLVFDNKWVSVKAMAQVFWVNYQTNAKEDPNLAGYNLRANLQIKIPFKIRIPFQLLPFGNFAFVTNDVLNGTSGFADQTLQTRYRAFTYGAGFDLMVLGRSGLGFSYVTVTDFSPAYSAAMGGMEAMEPVTRTEQTFINAGVTYWVTDYVAIGARSATYRKRQDGQPDELDTSFFATLRLIL